MHEIVKSEGNERTVLFTETAERISTLFQKIRKQISKDLDMPGFRPGKVPRSIIDRQYGNIIKAEVADTVRRELTSTLIDEEDWILDDDHSHDEVELPVEGSPYSFQINFTLFQTPEPKGTDGIEVQIPPLDADSAVEDTIQSFREKMMNFEDVDRPSMEGDLVILETDPARDGGDPQVFSVRIGEEHIGKGFDQLVTGVEPGFEFSARMENQGQADSGSSEEEETARPTHRFRVTAIKKPVLPELDDEFARKAAGVDDLETLREQVRESVSNRYQQELTYLKERTVIDSLLKSNPFDPPEYMVKNLLSDYLERLGEEEPGENTVKAARELASDKVREFLILRAFAMSQGIEITDQEIEEEISPEESRASVVDRIRNRKALELILERADITDKEPDSDPKEDDEDQASRDSGADASSWKWVTVDEGQSQPVSEDTGEEGS
jgi:trigger factor